MKTLLPFLSKKSFVFTVLLLLSSAFSVLQAQVTLYSVQDGNWNSADTWESGDLTGTVTCGSAYGKTVYGTGTLFTTQTYVGLQLYSSTGNYIGTVQSISSNTQLTLTANAGTNLVQKNYRLHKVPGANDAVVISGNDIYIPSPFVAYCASLDLGISGNNTGETLTFNAAGSVLNVGGDINILGPRGNKTREILVNAGTLNVGGNLSMGNGQNRNRSNRITRVTITTGTVTVSGNLTFNNIAGSSPAQTQIIMSGGAGTFNLGGTFTVNNASGTLTPGTSSTFNFTGSNQDIPLVSLVSYNNIGTAGSGSKILTTNTSIPGNISLNAGTTMVIGAYTLTLNGTVTGAGTLKGSAVSNLVINGAAGTLNFDQTNAVSRSLNNLTLNSGSSATLGNALDVYGTIALSTATLNLNAKNLTLKSNSAGTARIGNLTGSTLNGATNVTVERYIPSRRAWSLVTSPLRNTGSIWKNWQNNGTPNGSTGANIWGPTGTNPTPGANGLNFGPSYSMKRYNNTNNTWNLTVTDTKNTNLSENVGGTTGDNKGFLLFATNPYDGLGTNITPPSSAVTTLSANGTLQQGNQSFTVSATNYTLVGNPYASPVDFSVLKTHNTAILDRFWIYDATIAPYGGYKLVFNNAGTYTMLPGNTPANDYRHLQSGQAVFVEPNAGGGTLTFKETDKSAPATSPDIYLVNQVPPQELSVNIYKDSILLDGILAQFDNAFSTALVPAEDARKNYNDGVNIAIDKGADGYILEGRPEITAKDTTFLWTWNMQANQTYHFVFKAALFNPLVKAYLEDAFTGIKTAVSIAGDITDISFSTTSDPASRALRRFRIVYVLSSVTLPVVFTDVKASVQNMPGLQSSPVIKVDWKVNGELNADRYEVEYSTNGSNFSKLGSVKATANNNGTASYSYLHLAPIAGINYYRIKMVEISGSNKYSIIVKATINAMGNPGITVYPNPVTNRQGALELKNQPAGNYELALTGSNGQVLSRQTISHPGGTISRQLSLPLSITPGIYQLLVTAPDRSHYNISVTIITQ